MIEQSLVLEQKQKLHLTPQMRQSIRILQMNLIHLRQWLDKASQDNPVLELDLNNTMNNDEGSYQINPDENEKESGTGIPADLNKESHQLFDHDFGRRADSINRINQQQEDNYQTDYSYNINLRSHLLLQLELMVNNEKDFKIGEYIIDNINDNGYLTNSCSSIAEDLDIPEKNVKQILAMIQSSSIPGLGARNLRECLLLQLKNLPMAEKGKIKQLISNYLDDLSKKNFKKIKQALHLSFYEIQHLLDIIIHNFDPKPGRIFPQKQGFNFLIPDIIVKKMGNEYEIQENKSYLPRVTLNKHYQRLIKDSLNKSNTEIAKGNYVFEKEQDDEMAIHYLKTKMKSAIWIMHCVEQRRQTVLKISRFIIDYQREFLDKGMQYLKSLSLKKAAESLQMHESTISRAIRGKRIQIPRGIYEMKFFFSKGLMQNKTEKCEMISQEKIKNLIRQYILAENSFQPYSDQELASLLSTNEKIKVARRTITKYRKLLHISSSKMRRRYKKNKKNNNAGGNYNEH